MKNRKNRYIEPLISGILSVLAMIVLNDGFINAYVKTPSNNPSSSTGGNVFYGIMHFLDKKLGVLGVYLPFLLLAFFFFYKSYKVFKRDNPDKFQKK